MGREASQRTMEDAAHGRRWLRLWTKRHEESCKWKRSSTRLGVSPWPHQDPENFSLAWSINMAKETVIRAAACYSLIRLSLDTMPGVFSQCITTLLWLDPLLYVPSRCLEHDSSSILFNRKADVRLARRMWRPRSRIGHAKWEDSLDEILEMVLA